MRRTPSRSFWRHLLWLLPLLVSLIPLVALLLDFRIAVHRSPLTDQPATRPAHAPQTTQQAKTAPPQPLSADYALRAAQARETQLRQELNLLHGQWLERQADCLVTLAMNHGLEEPEPHTASVTRTAPARSAPVSVEQASPAVVVPPVTVPEAGTSQFPRGASDQVGVDAATADDVPPAATETTTSALPDTPEPTPAELPAAPETTTTEAPKTPEPTPAELPAAPETTTTEAPKTPEPAPRAAAANPDPAGASNAPLVIPDQPKNMSFMEGCWISVTELYSVRDKKPVQIEYCFNANGKGEVAVRSDSYTCRGRARASMPTPTTLVVKPVSSVTCDNRSNFNPWQIVCNAKKGGAADCLGVHGNGNKFDATLLRKQ